MYSTEVSTITPPAIIINCCFVRAIVILEVTEVVSVSDGLILYPLWVREMSVKMIREDSWDVVI